MRALLVRAFGHPPELADIDDPVPGPEESIVRIAAVNLAHLDRSVASGTFSVAPPLPYIPCTDGAGWIEQSEVFPTGALVWLRGGGLGVSRNGTAAASVAVPNAAVHLAPAGTDPTLAACFFSPAASAHLSLHAIGNVRPGECVAVSGAAGAVGSLAVQLALRAGAGQVIGLVSAAQRARHVPAGATVMVGSLDGAKVDLLIDTVGGPGFGERIAAVAPGGRAVLVGYTAGTRVELDLPALLHGDVTLLPLNMIRRAPQAFELADALLRQLTAGELTLRVTPYGFPDVASAWRELAEGHVSGRIVLVP
jgi:NADPH:quinone reductase-like Zn-dependent oxidoreductase